MDRINFDDFMRETNETEKRKDFNDYFNVSCKKCNSTEIEFISFDYIAQGSEYTGLYGDAGAIFKCIKCGNAVRVLTKEY